MGNKRGIWKYLSDWYEVIYMVLESLFLLKRFIVVTRYRTKLSFCLLLTHNVCLDAAICGQTDTVIMCQCVRAFGCLHWFVLSLISALEEGQYFLFNTREQIRQEQMKKKKKNNLSTNYYEPPVATASSADATGTHLSTRTCFAACGPAGRTRFGAWIGGFMSQ